MPTPLGLRPLGLGIFIRQIPFAHVITYTHCIHAGDTYYVLTKSPSGSTYWLWNPSTAEFYDQHDTNCPLISIGCIFNAVNVC